ncbi:uncharacterized protein IWZ02DRAFT_442755 [Phyllosticta citriasiana]|uniref:uncharacterized protein n=1 Tax=Phyllosticta citriasiana TaxID=595635 RepID=UPI0030FDBDF5
MAHQWTTFHAVICLAKACSSFLNTVHVEPQRRSISLAIIFSHCCPLETSQHNVSQDTNQAARRKDAQVSNGVLDLTTKF